jgi:hypothetical protein
MNYPINRITDGQDADFTWLRLKTSKLQPFFIFQNSMHKVRERWNGGPCYSKKKVEEG